MMPEQQFAEQQLFLPPSVSSDGVWNTTICGCCCESTVLEQCIAWCLPCVTYADLNSQIKIHPSERIDVFDCAGQSWWTAAASYCIFQHGPILCSTMCSFFVLGYSIPCCPMCCIIHSRTRQHLRTQNIPHPIRGTTCDDCLLTTFCSCCALLQEQHQLSCSPVDTAIPVNHMI